MTNKTNNIAGKILKNFSSKRDENHSPIENKSSTSNQIKENKISKTPLNVHAGSSAKERTFNVPTYDQISIRAYELFKKRSCEDGHAFEDWLQAEKELRAEKSKK